MVIGAGIYFFDKFTSPKIDLKISSVQVVEENGEKELKILLSGKTENLAKEKLNLAVWFYLEDKAEWSWKKKIQS